MQEKFEIEVNIGLGRIAVARMFVTESEYELLCNLSKIINDPWQEDYSPRMEVKKLPK